MQESKDQATGEARRLRALERKKHIVAHRSQSFDEAEAWDLAYWQSKTPQERLSAHVDILRDVELVEKARREYECNS